MRKLLNVIIFTFVLLQLLSCGNKKDYVEMIPADSDFVIQLNPKTIAQKGNFKNIEQYNVAQLTLNEIYNTDPELKKLIDEIKKSPTEAGIDIVSPIYIFGKKVNNKIIVTLAMNMNSKSDFENHLKTIYKSVYNQEITFTEEDQYTFINGNKKPFIAWNKKQFFFIAGEYGTPTSTINTFFEELIKNENSLINNISFADFIKNSQDLNIWYTGDFTKYFTTNSNQVSTELDFSKSSWATYLSFNENNISFTQKFHPDPATKVKIQKRPMWKSKINTDFYKYFPERSYANLSFGAYPTNSSYIFNNKNILSDFFNEYNIDIKILEQSFEGEALLSIYDFKSAKVFSVNDYFGKKESFEKAIIIPQFILAGRMKNKFFFDQFISNFGKGVTNFGKYYALKINANESIYFSYQQNVMFITNNQTELNNFILNRVSKNNFIQSPYAAGAKNPMFANANLNLEDYPIEVKQYFFQNSPIPISKEMEEFVNKFSKLEFNVTDEYTKTGKLEFKNDNINSLETLLLFLDQTYSVLSNPGI